MKFQVTIEGPMADPQFAYQRKLMLEGAIARAFMGCTVEAVVVNESGDPFPCQTCKGTRASGHTAMCPHGRPSSYAVLEAGAVFRDQVGPAAPDDLADPFDAG